MITICIKTPENGGTATVTTPASTIIAEGTLHPTTYSMCKCWISYNGFVQEGNWLTPGTNMHFKFLLFVPSFAINQFVYITVLAVPTDNSGNSVHIIKVKPVNPAPPIPPTGEGEAPEEEAGDKKKGKK